MDISNLTNEQLIALWREVESDPDRFRTEYIRALILEALSRL